MKKYNIDCDSIKINGNIFCNSDIMFIPDDNIDKSYPTIKTDININGNLYVICDKMYIIVDKNFLNKYHYNSSLISALSNKFIDDELSKSYDKKDFKIIRADEVYLKCNNLKVGKDIWAYSNKFDELRKLKLENLQCIIH